MKRLAALTTITALTAASVLVIAAPASADPFPVSYEVELGGTSWEINTDAAGIGHTYDVPNELSSANHSYGELWIEDFGAWCDTTTAVLTTDAATGDVIITCDAQESDVTDLFVSVEYRFYATGDLARMFYTIENRGAVEVSPYMYLYDNLDYNEVLQSSSGDTTGALTATDTWFLNTSETETTVTTSSWAVKGNTTADSSLSDLIEYEAYHDFADLTDPDNAIPYVFPAGSTTYVASFMAVTMPVAPYDEAATTAAIAAAVAGATQFDTFTGRLTTGLPAGVTVLNWGAVPAAAAAPSLPPTGNDNSALLTGGAAALLVLLAGIALVAVRRHRAA